MERESALAHVREFHTDAIARRATEAVAAARNAGATWREIAAALGTTQPYAVRKYKPRLAEHRQVTVRTDLKCGPHPAESTRPSDTRGSSKCQT